MILGKNGKALASAVFCTLVWAARATVTKLGWEDVK